MDGAVRLQYEVRREDRLQEMACASRFFDINDGGDILVTDRELEIFRSDSTETFEGGGESF